MSFDEGEGTVEAEDVEGRVEAIGIKAVRGDDGGGDVRGQAEAGVRVEDVRITDAVDGEVLFGGPGGGDGSVGQD